MTKSPHFLRISNITNPYQRLDNLKKYRQSLEAALVIACKIPKNHKETRKLIDTKKMVQDSINQALRKIQTIEQGSFSFGNPFTPFSNGTN